VFYSYGKGLRFIYWEDGGRSAENWYTHKNCVLLVEIFLSTHTMHAMKEFIISLYSIRAGHYGTKIDLPSLVITHRTKVGL
jgi:hypothetical protein